MNPTLAARLRDLLDRRFAQVAEAWRAYDRADRAADADHTPDAAFDERDECSQRYAFALIHYRHAFGDEHHLADVWRLAARLASAIPRDQPDWWRDHRFEWGWKLVNDIEPMPTEVDHRLEPVQRFHDWVLDQLAIGAAATSVLERYVRGVSLFECEVYREALLAARPPGDTSNRDERLACVRMASWLHAQGLDPYTELQVGTGRADVAVPSGPDAVAVEAKVVRDGDDATTIRNRVLGGLTQARAYAERLGHPTGYLLVFWLCDTSFLELRDEVRFGDIAVRVLIVDLRSKPPSELGQVSIVPFPAPFRQGSS